MKKAIIISLISSFYFIKAQQNFTLSQIEEILSKTDSTINVQSIKPEPKPSKVNFEDYESIMKQVKIHRKNRLVHFQEFLEMAKDSNTIILDTRSTEMYQAKHIKGAIHLSFPDFNINSLEKVIKNKNTRILIYCNNNIDNDNNYFISKVSTIQISPEKPKEELTMALNIPTFINLYGYGYTNVYELADLVSIFDNRLIFEGSRVAK